MSQTQEFSRREFINAATATAGGLLLAGCSGVVQSGGQAQTRPGEPGRPGVKVKAEAEVSPAEDLMREHGVLRRVLLVYGEAARLLEAEKDLPPEVLKDACGIIRSFIEDYHERLEEDYLFPRFRKAKRLADLVDVLAEQHKAGRRLTDATMRLATSVTRKKAQDRRKLVGSLQRFIRMYQPHAAREDTVLFPALHTILTDAEYHDLGEDFERKEHELFGDEGFEKMVDRVAAIEKTLGLYDLEQFTPKG